MAHPLDDYKRLPAAEQISRLETECRHLSQLLEHERKPLSNLWKLNATCSMVNIQLSRPMELSITQKTVEVFAVLQGLDWSDRKMFTARGIVCEGDSWSDTVDQLA